MVSLLEGESGFTLARKTYPARHKPDRACLAACLAEAARGTDYDVRVLVLLAVTCVGPTPVSVLRAVLWYPRRRYPRRRQH